MDSAILRISSSLCALDFSFSDCSFSEGDFRIPDYFSNFAATLMILPDGQKLFDFFKELRGGISESLRRVGWRFRTDKLTGT